MSDLSVPKAVVHPLADSSLMDPLFLQRILETFKELEIKHSVTIIYAVDGGSRAWGLNSDTSDYDIRFIYIKNDISEYVSCMKKDDTICGFTDDRKLDWQGWDIVKAVTHLKESNPSMIEWMYSPIVYVNKFDFKANCLKTIKEMHTHMSLMYHYFNMAKTNWKDWIDGKEKDIICKKYFYVIRPIATLQYILEKYISEPDKDFDLIINFEELVCHIRSTIPDETFLEVSQLLEKKRNATATETCDPILPINNWVADQFERFEQITRKENSGGEKKGNDIDFKAQSIISTHKKLDNETRKIIAIIGKVGQTARSNYLSAIGFGLQLIWLTENPDKKSRDLPQKIHQLMKEVVGISDDIRREISGIIDNQQEGVREEESKITFDDIYKLFIRPGLQYMRKEVDSEETVSVEMTDAEIIDKLGLLMNVKDSLLTYSTKPKRNDSVEFVIRNFVNTLWILGNIDSNQSDIPRDIINSGDPTGTIPEDILKRAKKTIDDLRPKYIISSNAVINCWLLDLIEFHKQTVKSTQDNLLKIRDINTEIRFKKSIRKIAPERFDDIIRETIKNMTKR